MLQRGIETPDMDVRWVSSLSWYFLNFFGLNGLYRLILGSDNCMSHSASFSFEFRDRSCTFRLTVNPSPNTPTPPLQIHLGTRDLSDRHLSTGGFLIAASLLCIAVQFHAWPIKNDQRRPNHHRRWQVHLPGRCNRVSLGSRWTITRSFQLSGTTSDSQKGCIIGSATMSRPVF